MIEKFRQSVRPGVTYLLVASTIAAAFVDLEIAKFLSGLTGAAFGFWFGGRGPEKQLIGAQ